MAIKGWTAIFIDGDAGACPLIAGSPDVSSLRVLKEEGRGL